MNTLTTIALIVLVLAATNGITAICMYRKGRQDYAKSIEGKVKWIE